MGKNFTFTNIFLADLDDKIVLVMQINYCTKLGRGGFIAYYSMYKHFEANPQLLYIYMCLSWKTECFEALIKWADIILFSSRMNAAL